MARLILIQGCSGAGKETTAGLLFSRLTSCAWVDIKALIKVAPWHFDDRLIAIGVENGAALVGNFLQAGYTTVIFSGGVGTQTALDLLEARIVAPHRTDYVWLHAEKAERDGRRLGRARDPADRAEHLDQVDRAMPDPGPLQVRNGTYRRLDTTHRPAEAVVEELLAYLPDLARR